MNRWIAPTFDEFGRLLGIEGLEPDLEGGLLLRLGSDRQLVFQVLDDSVIVLLVAALPSGTSLATKARAMALCHRRHGWNLPVRAGLTRDRQLIFLTRIPSRQFLLPVLESAFDLLNRLHVQARGG